MAMRQWDGGPKDVPSGAGFFGGAALGLAQGMSEMGLQGLAEEGKMRIIAAEDEAERARMSTKREWDKEDNALLRTERLQDEAWKFGLEKDYELGREGAEHKREDDVREDEQAHAIELQENKDKEANARQKMQESLANKDGDKVLTSTERKSVLDLTRMEINEQLGYSPHLEWDITKGKIMKEHPKVLEAFREFEQYMVMYNPTFEQARYKKQELNEKLAQIMSGGGDDATPAPGGTPPPGGGGPSSDRQEALRNSYGVSN